MNNEFIIKEIIRFFEEQGFWVEIHTDQTPIIKIILHKHGFEKIVRYNTLRLSNEPCLDTMYANLREDLLRIIQSRQYTGLPIEKLTKPVEKKYVVRCDMVKPINVIFNGPATIVFWNDGTKTIVKCSEGDTFDAEKGLAMAYSKKLFGNKGNYCKHFKKWLPKEGSKEEVKINLSLPDASRVAEGLRKLGEALKKSGRGM